MNAQMATTTNVELSNIEITKHSIHFACMEYILSDTGAVTNPNSSVICHECTEMKKCNFTCMVCHYWYLAAEGVYGYVDFTC